MLGHCPFRTGENVCGTQHTCTGDTMFMPVTSFSLCSSLDWAAPLCTAPSPNPPSLASDASDTCPQNSTCASGADLVWCGPLWTAHWKVRVPVDTQQWPQLSTEGSVSRLSVLPLSAVRPSRCTVLTPCQQRRPLGLHLAAQTECLVLCHCHGDKDMCGCWRCRCTWSVHRRLVLAPCSGLGVWPHISPGSVRGKVPSQGSVTAFTVLSLHWRGSARWCQQALSGSL